MYKPPIEPVPIFPNYLEYSSKLYAYRPDQKSTFEILKIFNWKGCRVIRPVPLPVQVQIFQIYGKSSAANHVVSETQPLLDPPQPWFTKNQWLYSVCSNIHQPTNLDLQE